VYAGSCLCVLLLPVCVYFVGFDVKSRDGYEQMMSQFDSVVGLKYLKAMHINDSKGTNF
jgi:AP endonuclease-1